MTTYTEVRYLSADQLVIRLTRQDGSVVTVEPWQGEFWTLVAGGQFGTVQPYQPPPPPSAEELRAAMKPLTRRQVFIGLVSEGLMTSAEAVAASASGQAPASIEAIFSAMQEPAQTAARITFASFTVAYRTEPIVGVLAAANSLTDAELDAFWTTYVNV